MTKFLVNTCNWIKNCDVAGGNQPTGANSGKFCVALFSQISRIILLSHEIKFRKILPCHAFYVTHVDHSQKYILQNY